MIKEIIPGASRVFSNISPIIIFFVFAQILDVNDLGLINYFISLITIIGIFTDFGIPEAIQRFLPQTKEKATLITHTIKLELAIVLAVGFLLLLSDILTISDVSKGFPVLVLGIIIFSASNTIILIFNGLDDKKRLTQYFGLSSILFILTTFLLYFTLNFNPILAFLLGRCISWLIYTIIPIYTLIQKNLFNIRTKTKDLKRFNQFAVSTFIYTGSIALLTQWDSIWITHIDGAYANGIYKSVAFIATIPIVLVTIIHTKLLPFLSKLNSEGKFKEIKKHLITYSKYLLLLVLTGFIIQLFIYKPLLNIFLDEEIVLQAGHIFPIVFAAISLYIVATPFVASLQAIGEEKFIRNLALLQASFFIFATLFLYNNYGYIIFPILLFFLNLILLIITSTYSFIKLNRYSTN